VSRRCAALALLLGLGWCIASAQAPGSTASPTASPAAPASAPADASLPSAELLKLLRKGGLIVYFRHTATDFSRRDDAMKSFDDCDNQRPLSAQGRADATMLGERIRALRLPVGDVLASPMCRTMDHARLTFRRATPTPELRERQDGDYPGLTRLLGQPVAAGTNRWIVSHGIPFRAATGLPPLAEGEAAVFRVEAGAWQALGRIGIDEWRALKAPR
jgi:Histidine phosphatase superfamily (branch 1)